MFGLGKKAAAAKNNVVKAANKDYLEALMSGLVWLASADGELEAEELDRIEAICQSDDRVAHFTTEITTLITKYKEKFEKVGAVAIRHEAKKQLTDIKHNAEMAADVFVYLIAEAQADGEIEPAERKALEEVGRMFSLRIEDFE